MQKILFIILLVLTNKCFSQFNSFSALFQNNTNYEFKITENKNYNCSKCVFCWDEHFFMGANNGILKIHALSDGVFNDYNGCGVSGEFKLECKANGQTYQGSLFYNRPFVGDNVFFYVIDAPFRLSIMNYDESYETYYMQIDGGPDEVTNTIALPENGNHFYQFIINLKHDGPLLPLGLSLADILDIKITAPIGFEEKQTGNYYYSAKKGNYYGAHQVGKINCDKIITLANGDKQIKVTINNLPENIPLTPSVDIVSGISFPLPNPLPAEASYPCGTTLSKYNVWLTQVSNDIYNLESGYLCGNNNSQSNISSPSQRFIKLKNQMVTNPASWNNKNAFIFQKSSNVAVKAASLNLNQQIKNTSKVYRQ